MTRPLNPLLTLCFCLYLGCLQMHTVGTEISTHSISSVASANTIIGGSGMNNLMQDKGASTKPMSLSSTSSASLPASAIVNTDFIDKMSWKCANNASCIYSLAHNVLSSYRRGETVKLGFFDLVKLPPTTTMKHHMKSGWNGAESGRSISTFMDFISGNAIRIPIGPMVFSVQRAEDDGNYIEVALLKKAVTQGRRQQEGREGGEEGSMFPGGLLSGNDGSRDSRGGLFSGHGGVGGGYRNRKKQQEDKKLFQMYIPMYLAATTFGWTMVVAKAVGVLTLKALAISKIAFIAAAILLIKKFMDSASEKMMYQYPEHTPYMMPYGIDYSMHSGGAGPDLVTGNIYPAGLPMAAITSMAAHPQSHPIEMEHLSAESNLHQNIADVHNSTQLLAALNTVGLGPKIKREDSKLTRTSIASRRPLMYNYLHSHHPYYKA